MPGRLDPGAVRAGAPAESAAVIVLRLRHAQPRVFGSTSVQALKSAGALLISKRSEPRALPARQELHVHFHGLSAEDVAAIIKRERGE
jgi:hypothetical protein